MSINSVPFQNQLQHISVTLKDAWNLQRVCITEDGECSTNIDLRTWAPGFLACLFPKSYQEENRKTIEYFYNHFGARRVIEIGKRFNIDFVNCYTYGRSISRGDVEALFVGLADVRLSDLERAMCDIRDNQSRYINIDAIDLQTRTRLREEFAWQHSVCDLSKHHVDALYDILIPVRDINTLFLENVPQHATRGNDRDVTYVGKKKRIYLIESMRRNMPYLKQFEVDYRKSKKILSYHTPEGLVIPERKGYRFVHKKVEGGGAYKFFLKRMHRRDNQLRSQVVALSTQALRPVPYRWEALLDDAHPNIGSIGARATYEETNLLLNDTTQGFIERADEKVDLMGHSLGGTHAIRDLALFWDRVHKVKAIGNPGIDEDTAAYIARLSQEPNQPRKTIDYTWEARDLVPRIGDMHAGHLANFEKLRVKLRKLSLPNEEVTEPEQTSEYMIFRLWEIFKTLVGVHTRETTGPVYEQGFFSEGTTERPYISHTYSTDNPNHRGIINEQLNNKQRGWEDARRSYMGWLGYRDEFIKYLNAIHVG